jgi:hypothetical protein
MGVIDDVAGTAALALEKAMEVAGAAPGAEIAVRRQLPWMVSPSAAGCSCCSCFDHVLAVSVAYFSLRPLRKASLSTAAPTSG